MLIEIAILIFALFLVWKSSEIVLENSIILSHFFNASEFVVGFLLVSLATSLPELSIAITSLWQNASSVSVGNVIGSNFAEVTYVFGAILVFQSFSATKDERWKASNILMLCSLLIFLPLLFPSLLTSFFLIACFFAFAFLAFKQKSKVEKIEVSKRKALTAFVFFAIGIFLLLTSASFTVKNAIYLASILNVSGVAIGATLVSLGTTLPELTIGIQSARRGNYELALGDSIGSVAVNSTLVLGVGSLSSPRLGYNFFIGAFCFLLAASFASFLLRKNILTKKIVAVLILEYVLFLSVNLWFA